MSAPEDATPKLVLLKTFDGQTFEVQEKVALVSQTIKTKMEYNCTNKTITLPYITGRILAKVIEYCNKHADKMDGDVNEDDVKAFDDEFCKGDHLVLFDLILAAKDLNIQSLMDLTCKVAGYMTRNKTPEEVMKIYKVNSDFTGDEKQEVYTENLHGRLCD